MALEGNMLSNKPFKDFNKRYENGLLSIKWKPKFNERFYEVFKEGGELQQEFDAQLLNGMTPYVPRDTGAMLDFALTNTVLGSGKIIFRGDYVLPQYAGFRTTEDGRTIFFENYSNQTGFRGPEWFDRFIKDHGDETVDYLNKRAGEMMNGR